MAPWIVARLEVLLIVQVVAETGMARTRRDTRTAQSTTPNEHRSDIMPDFL
jgi:hypothetical protein